MTGKEFQKAVMYGDKIEEKDLQKVVWVLAVTEDDIDEMADELGHRNALEGEDRNFLLRKIKNDRAKHEIEKKLRRKAKLAIIKYVPADDEEKEETGEESWSFLGCDFPDQMD